MSKKQVAPKRQKSEKKAPSKIPIVNFGRQQNVAYNNINYVAKTDDRFAVKSRQR